MSRSVYFTLCHQFFKISFNVNFQITVYYNPAEYFIEVISIDVNEPERSKNEIDVNKLV